MKLSTIMRSVLLSLTLLSCALLLSGLTTATSAQSGSGVIAATNPLGQFLTNDTPDPDVIRIDDPVEGVYYVLTHTVMIEGNDIPIYSSRDLVNWELQAYAFGITPVIDISPHVGDYYYCQLWAPEIRAATVNGVAGYLFSFTGSRYATQQNCTITTYDEGSGTYVAFGSSPFGPFVIQDGTETTMQPEPTGVDTTLCAQTFQSPFSYVTDTPDCHPQDTNCQNTMRLDPDMFNDTTTQEAWYSYSWYTNSQPITPFDFQQSGEHVSIVRLNYSDPRHVSCESSEVERVWAISSHDEQMRQTLSEYCPRCSEQLAFCIGRDGSKMHRGNTTWCIAEASMMFRRNGYVYLLASHSVFDSAFYSVMWIAAPTMEELSWEGGSPNRIIGRFLIPSQDQSFGHGTAILGPDNQHWYYIHHHLNHTTCNLPSDPCPRDIYISPLNFVDQQDGRGDVWIEAIFPAEIDQVMVYQANGTAIAAKGAKVELQ